MKKTSIIILDDVLISKIAAGEVIERPASVVKELVENSIDAGASRIRIEIRNGGRDLIRVIDNGSGMTREESRLSLERHSTSKITSDDDLFRITTLGFRGEALPSIASVTRFEMMTKPKDDDDTSGTVIIAEGGKVKEVKDTGCPAGTTISASKLFFNTPARLKFLKSPNTEFSHIANLVTKFILSNPEISFQLINDGEELYSSPGSGKPLDAIASVYGVDVIDSLLEVKKDDGMPVLVSGFISQPVITKSDRGDETFFVNGRYVRNMLLSRALEDAYRNIIPGNRYPIAVLYIYIDPSKIDVNVHPSKREIKFEKPDEAIRAVKGAVSKALSLSKVPTLNSEDLIIGGGPVMHGGNIEMFDRLSDLKGTISTAEHDSASGYSALTQVLDTYIIAVKDDELILVDQHAAHERILFEKLRSNDIRCSQKLLINQTIEFPHHEAAALKDNLNALAELGFEIEDFGRDSFIIRAIPSILEFNQAKEAVQDLLTDLMETFKIKDSVKRRDEMNKMLACKGAVKAGDKLTFQEMDNLLKDISRTGSAATCPHGRPTIMKFTGKELEKIFKRT